ncbi:DUF4185 domain-containing protein [Thalassoglobus sp. JC818]|uniref:DUF4185 domain-containing protein n=1 Tax=Thalassoglobus sp. JC818 TaxID=3232136 RepID=UPI0034589D2D
MRTLPCYVLILTQTLFAGIASGQSPISPWSENPWYWSYHGEPVLLLGGSDDDNLFQWQDEDLIAQLDRLADADGNVIRNTMSDRKDKGFEVYPFRKLDNGRYDLEQWNDEYWTRFERLLSETAKREIFVQIEIWDRFDYTDHREDRWQIHPYNPVNNVNYTYEQTGFAERYPDHPGSNKQPFFFTTPEQRHNKLLLQYQQKFVNKLLDHSLHYDHILYCIDNETKADEQWGRYWAQFIKNRAQSENKTICVTEMWDDWNLQADRHKQTFDHPELYDFVDVSQNNHNKGQEHWDNFLFVRDYLSNKPRPINTTKTYGASGNKFGHSDQDGIERFWRHLLAGAASIRFHRPDSGLGLGNKAVNCLRAARNLESLVPLWSIEPDNDLLSDRQQNEAYAAADRGNAYVVYFPAGGDVTIDLTDTTASHIEQWIDIDTGEFGERKSLKGGGKRLLTAPGKGNWVVVITAAPNTQSNVPQFRSIDDPPAPVPEWQELNYPSSDRIVGIEFDAESRRTEAPGSDIWPITWADDDRQYTAFGDGGGFGGSNQEGRVSMGVACVMGALEDYQTKNVWGGKDADRAATMNGKGTGIISVDGTLYMWVGRPKLMAETGLAFSQDHGRTWELADWHWSMHDRVSAGVFINCGRDNSSAPDGYIYACFTRIETAEVSDRGWIYERPGRIDLARVPRERVLDHSVWEWFSGMDANNKPQWSLDISSRQPAFEDPNGIKIVSICYQPAIQRYLLSYSPRDNSGNYALFEAQQPWGPWHKVVYLKSQPLFMPPKPNGRVSTFHFAPKWWSSDGTEFGLVFNVGDDAWNTVYGKLKLR